MNHPGGGMVTMNAGASGPVGGAPMVNNVAARQQQSMQEQEKLNTYIYDYLCKSQHWDIARLFLSKCQVKSTMQKPPSPSRGVDDMDTDTKDEKRPDDLPYPSIPPHPSDNAFLYDWWCQFWDIFAASRDPNRRMNPTTTADTYLHHNQSATRARQMAQHQMLQQTDRNLMMRQQYGQAAMAGMQPNGMNNMARQAMQNNKNNPQAAMQMQQKMMANQMQRDGSMGDNRAQSPNSIENMGSPSKRPRTDGGNFNGQPGPAGRGQTMPSQQMGTMPGGNGSNGMILQNGLTNDMSQQQMNAFSASTPNAQQKSLEAMNANGGPQGPIGQQTMEGQMDFINQQRLANGGQGTQQGNHALQDYQMQLMLLEQQNKKRLLMARQEQDNINHVPAGSAPGAFAPAMSPSGSRAGPSPNPNDQMNKRVAGTPKMGQGVIPGSPMPEMPNRGSPAPGFDAPQGRGQQFFNMGGNPAMMGGQPAPSSHPQFNMQMPNMGPQAMEQMRMANGRGMPNGAWQGQGPPQQMMNQGQQPQQVGTPQRSNTAMPPPPAPSQEQQRTQPSSPAQPAAPPTPSAAPKSGPKGKKEGAAPKKKTAPKKNAAAATPVADTSEPPPTPTPSTPITPMHTNSFSKGGNGQPASSQQAQIQAQQQPMDTTAPPFGDLGQDAASFNLDFAVEGTDVLENFDFDSFLHNTEDNSFPGFDLMNFGTADGVEAGAD